ncbi:helix-turn-helix domain-containing protein [Streptomyces neyagawaensis]|uniref:helix-turn-helix domain-containing protein n=2 Tax=Streptomyces neyagawaensis TaxID=42238 RepID=UPI00201D1D65|nr:helix-turn-helix transcriptional regulator [Streptomyces neyagawaensis]MCL6734704.1 helix-turn-helix domain-containing protein [Streptomyces neyagawaensis]MDE1682132.1 helix-turn-helix transcriptional regulator [Streptomyces neyagawaensis]
MASTGDRGNAGKPEDGGELAPETARTSAEYVALLRRLKERSGLTYRQLEQRAAERGEVLARSTLADVLRRDALPRAEVVSALVRACGVPETAVPTWLAVRERLVVMGDAPREEERQGGAGRGSGDGPGGGGVVGGRVRVASLAAVASLGTVALIVVGALVWLPRDGASSSGGGDRDSGRTTRTSEPSGTRAGEGADVPVAPGPAPGLTRIRPVRAPDLCLTDGDVRVDSGESKVVAMQRPCEEAVPPKTYLLRADDGYYRIQWDHPRHGKGCLTLLSDSQFQHMFEPWDDCKVGGSSQLFRIERAEGTGKGTKGAWRLRPGRGDADICVGMRGGPEEKCAVAVAEGCADATGAGGASDAQLFLIGRDPTGRE